MWNMQYGLAMQYGSQALIFYEAWLPYDPESVGEWKLLFEHIAYKHSLIWSTKKMREMTLVDIIWLMYDKQATNMNWQVLQRRHLEMTFCCVTRSEIGTQTARELCGTHVCNTRVPWRHGRDT